MKRWFWMGLAALFAIMSVAFLVALLRSQPSTGISPEQKNKLKKIDSNLRKMQAEISSIRNADISLDESIQKSIESDILRIVQKADINRSQKLMNMQSELEKERKNIDLIKSDLQGIKDATLDKSRTIIMSSPGRGPGSASSEEAGWKSAEFAWISDRFNKPIGDLAQFSEKLEKLQADIKTEPIDYANVVTAIVPKVSDKVEMAKSDAIKRRTETLDRNLESSLDIATSISDSGDETKSGTNLNAFAGALIGIIGALSSLLHVWRSDRRENKRLEMEMLRLKMELKKTAT